jgi:hypothetical protein
MREGGMTEPYTFDMAYARCFAIPEMAVDKRHIFIMHDILRSWPFRSALEIGSFNGASATAFVEAINSGEGLGESGHATFCDVQPTHSLKAVAANCKHAGRVTITDQPSHVVLESQYDYDFIFVDGRHDLESVSRELKPLLRRKPLCVMAHDTSATDAGYRLCEGAKLLKDTFKALYGNHIEDSVLRDGERTERGLFFATNDSELAGRALAAFYRWA